MCVDCVCVCVCKYICVYAHTFCHLSLPQPENSPCLCLIVSLLVLKSRHTGREGERRERRKKKYIFSTHARNFSGTSQGKEEETVLRQNTK